MTGTLDRDALYRRIHAIPSLPHHGKAESCFPITDAVLDALEQPDHVHDWATVCTFDGRRNGCPEHAHLGPAHEYQECERFDCSAQRRGTPPRVARPTLPPSVDSKDWSPWPKEPPKPRSARP